MAWCGFGAAPFERFGVGSLAHWTERLLGCIYEGAFIRPVAKDAMLGLLSKIFTWWNSASAGAAFTIWRSGELVGKDEFGNRYFRERKGGTGADGKQRRWIVFNGYADASRVPSEWHGWMHHTFEEPPTDTPLARRAWEQDHKPNLTGTLHAYRPKGSLSAGSDRKRQRTSGDYEAWTPGD